MYDIGRILHRNLTQVLPFAEKSVIFRRAADPHLAWIPALQRREAPGRLQAGSHGYDQASP
jgi:hypothetical protein